MAPRWMRQIQLLLWKNFILQIRRPVGTTFEIIVPVIFSAILILARVGLQNLSSDKCFLTFTPTDSHLSFYGKFTFYPNTSWASTIVNSSTTLRKVLVSHDQSGKEFESEDAAAREASNYPFKYAGAIIFENVNSEELPKLISYKIRQSPFFDADTNRIYPQFQPPGPRTYSGYTGGFFGLQKEVDRTIIQLQTQQSNLLSADKITQFPYPSYKVDPFMTTVQVLLPIIFVIAFIYTAVCIIREIIREKKERLKEAMKMMGLANWVHWFSWFMKNFIFLAISCVLLTILLKVAKIFEYTDGTLLFVFFLSYSFSVIFFCFAISVFSCNVICGMLVGAILWILSYVPYAVLTSGSNSTYDIMTTAQKAAACLLPNTALGIGIQVLTKFEVAQIGGQWSNISTVPSIDENFTLLLAIAMFFAQSIVWWIITWYVEAVFPGEFGVPKPFYFFLTTSYWCGTTKCCGLDNKLTYGEELHSTASNIDLADVEPAPEGSEIGVDIRGLRKVFKASTGKRVAVDGLNLKIYKGQITALLGHNGAGKTTTISILTGLYTPNKGSAYINGRDIRTDMDRIRENMGLCPQHNVLWDRLTVEEHLEFFIALKGVSGKEAKWKIEELLRDIHLLDKRNARASTLSGGMKRKLCCAIALVGDPDIVFLDEPTSGMDPYARRATWNLLEKYAEKTTIILTTHFMDEADYLGDRIAIMTDGQLRCCGTSLYLKKKYGVGYRMTLVKNPEFFNEAEVSRMIEQTLPSVKMDSDTATEKSYVLEHKTSKKFRDLFEKLEEHKDELGVLSFGVSITTLEEVFLKVGEETAAADGNATVLPADDYEISIEKEKLTGIPLLLAQFRAMFTKRFLNSKREKKAVFTQLLLPLVIIIGGLALTRLSSLQSEQPPLTLDLSMLSKPGGRTYAYVADYRTNRTDWTNWTKYMDGYFDHVRVAPKFITAETLEIRKLNLRNLVTYKGKTYNLTKDGDRSCCNYQYLVLNSKCQAALDTAAKFKSLCGSDDKTFGYAACPKCIDNSQSYEYDCPQSIANTHLKNPNTIYNEYVLEHSNSKRFFNKYVAGITLRDDESKGSGLFQVDGWYSNVALHTLPSLVSAVDNIILRFHMNSYEYGITTINHPLPLNKQQQDDQAASDVGTIVMSIFATLTASFISASFVVFIISEKKSKAKHIQFISGVNSAVYWLATYCWDIINYLIPAVLIMISFAAFQDSYVKGGDLAVLCIVIFLFGFAILPFSYLLSFIFKSPFVAYAIISLFGFGVSVGMFFAVFFCRLQGSTCTSAAPIMHKIFLLIPMYGFSSSILDIRQNVKNRALCSKPSHMEDCLRSGTAWHESSLAFEYPGVGLTCLYFIIQSALFICLVILIEENFFISLKPRPPPPRPVQPEDDDISSEKQRVASMTQEDIMNAAVVIKDLTKTYKSNNITAVDAVSVCIPKGLCFGLLGVNGAGKTTTFSMLTGELGITGGTAYLSGFNIQQQLREVQKRIGYCPQFDALLGRLTGREMLEMFARLRGIPSRSIPDVVNTVLYQLNLNKYADKMCGTYSGGNKRKLSTAMAIVGDPPVLFLDEPTSGMDPVSRRFLWNTLTGILESNDRSIILTSHSMEECEALCNRLVIMVNGEFKCVGSLQHLKSKFGQGYMLSLKVGGRDRSSERQSFRKRKDDRAAIVLNEIDAAETTAPPEDPAVTQESTERVKQFIERYFPNSYLLEERPGMLQYQVLNAQLKWSYMFGTLEDNAANMNITDYSLSQTTLEQVFINFARFQRPEIMKKKKCCCCSC